MKRNSPKYQHAGAALSLLGKRKAKQGSGKKLNHTFVWCHHAFI